MSQTAEVIVCDIWSDFSQCIVIIRCFVFAARGKLSVGSRKRKSVVTKSLPFTQYAVRRAVTAARKAGMKVSAISIAPDGTVTVFEGKPIEPLAVPIQDAAPSKWAS